MFFREIISVNSYRNRSFLHVLLFFIFFCPQILSWGLFIYPITASQPLYLLLPLFPYLYYSSMKMSLSIFFQQEFSSHSNVSKVGESCTVTPRISLGTFHCPHPSTQVLKHLHSHPSPLQLICFSLVCWTHLKPTRCVPLHFSHSQFQWLKHLH